MLHIEPVEAFLTAGLPVIDVRSPGEFKQGHIPGAHNLPLFTNEERAVVGTLYKQTGRDAALLEGLRITGPKLAGIVENATAIAPEKRIAVHCWRGGERSASVAWLLEKAGFSEVLVLRKGYKAFRTHVLASLHTAWKLNVIGGATGSGKTELLGMLRDRGAQVVDLEGLANHKGSSFGAIGQAEQPSTEHFENMLWADLARLDPHRVTWVEDESTTIGRVKIPDGFFNQMRATTVFYVDMPAERRAERLAIDYGNGSRDELAAAIGRIAKKLGPQHAKTALEQLQAGNLQAVARIALVYYDKTYAHGLSKRDPARIIPITTDERSLSITAEQLLQYE
ncbi:MAG: tRNA 2-selenouridine(34) synthase MnmH [Flavobacteriales bacterium]|jgi:tRNA 2-selenouridine synthase|nr:tRNA 2-selenouridine(34) synthase MnmH [Flavobacteriales bacterium]